VGPYLFSQYIPFAARHGETCTAFGLLGFATTAATPARVRATLNAKFHLGEPGYTNPNLGSYVELRTSMMRIAGVPFTVLDYGFYECRITIALGRVGNVTYLIDLTAGSTDPTVDAILGSIRITQ